MFLCGYSQRALWNRKLKTILPRIICLWKSKNHSYEKRYIFPLSSSHSIFLLYILSILNAVINTSFMAMSQINLSSVTMTITELIAYSLWTFGPKMRETLKTGLHKIVLDIATPKTMASCLSFIFKAFKIILNQGQSFVIFNLKFWIFSIHEGQFLEKV